AAAVARTQGNPDPNDLAARLLQQRQQGGLQGMYRNVERVVGLFIASLVPDLGERRVRGFEQAAAPVPVAPVVAPEAAEAATEVRAEGEVGGTQTQTEEGSPVAEERQNVELEVDEVTDLPTLDGERERERDLI